MWVDFTRQVPGVTGLCPVHSGDLAGNAQRGFAGQDGMGGASSPPGLVNAAACATSAAT